MMINGMNKRQLLCFILLLLHLLNCGYRAKLKGEFGSVYLNTNIYSDEYSAMFARQLEFKRNISVIEFVFEKTGKFDTAVNFGIYSKSKESIYFMRRLPYIEYFHGRLGNMDLTRNEEYRQLFFHNLIYSFPIESDGNVKIIFAFYKIEFIDLFLPEVMVEFKKKYKLQYLEENIYLKPNSVNRFVFRDSGNVPLNVEIK